MILIFVGQSNETNEKDPGQTETDDETDDEEFEQLLQEAKKGKKKAKKESDSKKSKSYQQQMLELQQSQLMSFQDSEHRMQDMMLKLFEEQRKADAAEREKDREFMLALGKMFSSHT